MALQNCKMHNPLEILFAVFKKSAITILLERDTHKLEVLME